MNLLSVPSERKLMVVGSGLMLNVVEEKVKSSPSVIAIEARRTCLVVSSDIVKNWGILVIVAN